MHNLEADFILVIILYIIIVVAAIARSVWLSKTSKDDSHNIVDCDSCGAPDLAYYMDHRGYCYNCANEYPEDR